MICDEVLIQEEWQGGVMIVGNRWFEHPDDRRKFSSSIMKGTRRTLKNILTALSKKPFFPARGDWDNGLWAISLQKDYSKYYIVYNRRHGRKWRLQVE